MSFVGEEGTTTCSEPDCEKQLKTHIGLLQHRFSKHRERYSDGGYSCRVCEKYYHRMASGMQHERDKNHEAPKRRGPRKTKGRGDTPCPECEQLFRGQQGVKHHFRDVHQDKVYGDFALSKMTTSSSSVSVTTEIDGNDFLQLSPSSLDDFIAHNLQPTGASNSTAHKEVKKLVNFHQHNVGYSVKEIVVSGSFGKGTQVKGRADLDCVLILNDIKDHKELKAAGNGIFKNLEEVLRESTFATITDMKKTRFALKFNIEVNGKKMGVDLLPTFDTSSRDARRKRSLYQEILQCTRADRQFYSAALCHLQIEFIKKQPTKLKNLIRLVKYWNKTVVKPQAEKKTPALKYPTSYPLELISIYVCEKIGNKKSFDMAPAFKAVMQQLVDYKEITAVWYKNYGKQMAAKEIKEMEKPILLDPANPTNNVLSAFDGEALEHVAEIAKETLMKPLLFSVSLPSKFLSS